MEFGFVLGLLIGLFFLLTIFLPWVNRSRIHALRQEVDELRLSLGLLEKHHIGKMVTPPPVEQEKPAPEKPQTPVYETPQSTPLMPLKAKSDSDWIKTAQQHFEKNIATKLPVWIGAVSLIFAAFFLVKYSIELGWMQPSVRVSLGGLFGLILLIAGQWIIQRPHIANAQRMAQGLVGAGLVALYVSIYAALNLYELIPPMGGFIAMVAITAMAVILSLRHGQPIAVFGLLGGLLTPAVIGSDDPNAMAMFSYLFVLFSAMFAVIVKRGWWSLAVLAVIGVFSWSALWFVMAFSNEDAPVLVIFAVAIAGAVLAITGKNIAANSIEPKDKIPFHALNFAAITGGLVTIIWLSTELTLSLFDWSMLGLLSLALMVLAYFQPAIYQRPLWIKLGASLVLYFFWAHSAPLTDAIAVLIGLSAVYIGGGAFLMRQVSDPRFWAALQAITVIAFYLIAYFSYDLSPEFYHSFSMFWGTISLILASLAIYQAADIRRKYKADEKIQEYLVAIFALLASGLISAGLAIELPWHYVPLALAGQATITALIYKGSRIDFLKKIVVILTLAFAALNYEQIILFLDLFAANLEDSIPGSADDFAMNEPFIKLGLPALFFALTFGIFYKTGTERFFAHHIVFGAALLCALATFYYLIRLLGYEGEISYSNNNIFAAALSEMTGFIDRGAITLLLALTGMALLESAKRFDLRMFRPWAYGLLLIAALRYAFYDLLMLNPQWEVDQYVGEMILLNGITLTYGAATILFGWAVYSNEFTAKKLAYKIMTFISLFAFTSLSIRQYFQGGYLSNGEMLSTEFYSYSVVWLATGLILLAIGIARENKTARMASLAFVMLAIIKVFVFDAAELEGLYRVFSFLGLGVSLIGLSYFYSRFVFKRAD